jgi:hypothetical protein
MVDVGCGVGGSSRHISRKYGCSAQGITLSPVQAARANAISEKEGLGSKCAFQVRRARGRAGATAALAALACHAFARARAHALRGCCSWEAVEAGGLERPAGPHNSRRPADRPHGHFWPPPGASAAAILRGPAFPTAR